MRHRPSYVLKGRLPEDVVRIVLAYDRALDDAWDRTLREIRWQIVYNVNQPYYLRGSLADKEFDSQWAFLERMYVAKWLRFVPLNELRTMVKEANEAAWRDCS